VGAKMRDWEADLIKACMTKLKAFAYKHAKSKHSASARSRASTCLFTLGELVLHQGDANDDTHIPNDMATVVQTLLQRNPIDSKSQSPNASFTQSPDSMSGGDSSVRAHAFTALGKMCLRSKKLTKKMVPVLIQELRTGE
jgi:hypothetical protein